MLHKWNLHFAGITVPARMISEPINAVVELADGRKRPTQFANFISLRETNPDGPNPGQHYLQFSTENLAFQTGRFTNVIGLDVTEDGTMITLEDLEAARGAQITERQIARAARSAPPEAIDLDDLLAEAEAEEPADLSDLAPDPA